MNRCNHRVVLKLLPNDSLHLSRVDDITGIVMTNGTHVVTVVVKRLLIPFALFELKQADLQERADRPGYHQRGGLKLPSLEGSSKSQENILFFATLRP